MSLNAVKSCAGRLSGIALVCVYVLTGCGKSELPVTTSIPTPPVAPVKTAAHNHDHDHSHGDAHDHDHGHDGNVITTASDTKKPHSHDGWWCDEHGVPEEVCALCNSKVAAAFQKKGDWCQEHDRPESQCFACHPELETKFAAQYEAKYGTKPPKPQE